MKKSLTILTSLIIVTVVVLLAVNCVVLSKQNNQLKQTLERTVNAEWYQLSRMAEFMETYVFPDITSSVEYKLYVNQTCYYQYSSGGNYALSSALHNWLVSSYDSVFWEYANTTDDVKRNDALKLIKEMTAELTSISQNALVMMADNKYSLLDDNSHQSLELLSSVQLAEQKYKKEADDFFRKYG